MALRWISLIRFSLQLIVSVSVFLLWQPRKKRFGLRLTGSILFYCTTAALWFMLLRARYNQSIWIRILYYMGLFFLLLMAVAISFNLGRIQILFAGTGGYATEHIAYSLGKIFQFSTGAYEENIGIFWEHILIRILPYILVSVVTYLLLICGNRRKSAFKDKDIRLTMLAFSILLIAVIMSILYSDPNLAPQGVPVTEIICPIFGGICCFLALVLEYFILRENQMEQERAVMEEALQMASSQQIHSREAIEIINMKCHDLRHQIEALSQMDDAAERREYITEVKQAISIYDAAYHTGCDALDTVLTEKTLLAQQQEAAFSCIAEGSPLCFMRSSDIYALFGNALDNALECTSREPKDLRIISLSIRTRGTMILIHLENQCGHPVVFEDGLPMTDKEDKSRHGFGVRSISYIAEKYGDQCLMRRESELFLLDVLIPMPS